MYTCSMCKQQFDGDAAFKNACGEFCADCKATIHARSSRGAKERNQAMKGHCLWCGERITPAKMQAGKDDENVCLPCSTRRDWLLRAIRLSDRPAKYVARTEERERPLREERQKVMRSASHRNPEEAGAAADGQEQRLCRLEAMLTKLTQSLGV